MWVINPSDPIALLLLYFLIVHLWFTAVMSSEGYSQASPVQMSPETRSHESELCIYRQPFERNCL